MKVRGRSAGPIALAAALALLGGVAGGALPAAQAQSGTPTPAANVGGPSAVPSARFFGSVKVGNSNPPDGTTVVASVTGVACGFGTVANGQYFVDVQAIAGCTTPGASVSFAVGGQTASTTGTLPGVPGAVQLNLSVSQATPTPAPAATSAPTPPPPPSRPTTAPPPPPPPPPTSRTATPRPTTATPRTPTPAAARRQAVTGQKPAAAQPAARVALPKTGAGGARTDHDGLLAVVAGLLGLSLAGIGLLRLRRSS
ncbi:MAG TPA: hypothetical protein VKV26_15415 [Dehalococcoidia bacterium]|nr:hypothetical protein [Dehalococcoidia bacterium]